MDVLLLRLDAPMMSFGAPIIDNYGVIKVFPACSMICGLLGNALGYDHHDHSLLQRLQTRLRYACRQDHGGTRIRDYQTVDLGKPLMRSERAWTTHGRLEERKGGPASTKTHIRYRDYWADAVYTVAISLDPASERPTVEDLEQSFQAPERPLFIGRKACLPAGRLLLGRTQADDLLAPLCDPRWALESGKFRACWPTTPDPASDKRLATDLRDWANQIHSGERWIATGNIEVALGENGQGVI